ncbi:MAG: hypothetical protein AAF514_08320, partial [Verrucomicrobiota bacterium]
PFCWLLDHMAREKQAFDVLLSSCQASLEPVLEYLMVRQCVEINKSHHYQLTPHGREMADRVALRYTRWLTYFDVFSHVDLEAGEFALESYAEFESEADWKRFIQGARWEDLRVAVVSHLGGDPVELVFFHAIREDRATTTTAGWELDVRSGQAWAGILEICRNSVRAEDLGFESDEGPVGGEQVLDDVVEQGFKLVRQLSGEDRKVLAHLARWAPIRDPELAPDQSPRPVWQETWEIPLPE